MLVSPKLVASWRTILLGAARVLGAVALGLVAAAFYDSQEEPVAISACVESESIHPEGDADDPAIWVNRASPGDSVVISTDKQAGLHLYDLAGRELQFVPLGKTNNVDLRPDFPFPDGHAPIIAATNRTDQTVMLFRFDEEARRIDPEPVARWPGFRKGAGVCLYHAKDGSIQVGVTDGDEGFFKQWRLVIGSGGTITPQLVRSFQLKPNAQAEACVYDDALHRLYIAQERIGIWRFPAESDDGESGILIDRVGGDDFPPDVEGLAILQREDGTGYLIASNQGNSTFRIYRREGKNPYLGRFRIAGCRDGTVDAVTATDGIEVVNDSLGSEWPAGMLVVHDDGNRVGSKKLPNLKFVRWDKVQQLIDSWNAD